MLSYKLVDGRRYFYHSNRGSNIATLPLFLQLAASLLHPPTPSKRVEVFFFKKCESSCSSCPHYRSKLIKWSRIQDPHGSPGFALTLTEILPSSFGKCAARNQSPGSGLVTLKAPVVRFGRVHVSVTAKDPGTIVSPGKRVCSGLITGGAPDLKYLKFTGQINSFQLFLGVVFFFCLKHGRC